MKSLLLAENESKKTREMTDHRNKLSVEYGRVRLEVYHWEESWRTMKMCQRFLYQIAPISWRTEHDWIHRSHSGESITYDHTEDLFGRYRMLGDVASLDALIGDYTYTKYLSFISPSIQKNNSTCGKILRLESIISRMITPFYHRYITSFLFISLSLSLRFLFLTLTH